MSNFFGGPAGRSFRIAKIFKSRTEMSSYIWGTLLEDEKYYLSFGDFVQIKSGATDNQSGSIWEIVLAEDVVSEGDIIKDSKGNDSGFGYRLVLNSANLEEGTFLKGVTY